MTTTIAGYLFGFVVGIVGGHFLGAAWTLSLVAVGFVCYVLGAVSEAGNCRHTANHPPAQKETSP